MLWQDYVIAIGQIFFVFALIPSIRSSNKPALITSVTYASIITVIATSLLTLGLWFSAATGYMGAIAWAILALQKYNIQKANGSKK